MNKGKRNVSVQFILNLFWALAQLTINILINFKLTPFIISNIGIEAYGFVSLAETMVSYIDLIAVAVNSFLARNLGMAYHQGETQKTNQYFSSALFANALIIIVVLIPASCCICFLEHIIHIPAELIPDIKALFVFVLLNYCISLLATGVSVIIFVVNRLELQSKLTMFAALIRALILVTMFSKLPPKVWYVSLSALTVDGIAFLVNIYLSKRLMPSLAVKKVYISLPMIGQLMKSGIWNSVNRMGTMLNTGLDLLICNLRLSATDMGNVSIAKRVAALATLFTNQVAGIFMPHQLKLYSEGNKEELIKELKLAMRLTGLIGGIVIAVFAGLGNDFIRLWIPGSDAQYVYRLTILALIGDVLMGCMIPLYYVFTITGKVKYPSCVTVVNGAVNIISMLVLLNYTELGAYVILITTAFCNVFVNLLWIPLYTAHCLQISKSTFYPVIMKYLLSVIICSEINNKVAEFGIEVIDVSSLLLMGCVLGCIALILMIGINFRIYEIRFVFEKIRHRGV